MKISNGESLFILMHITTVKISLSQFSDILCNECNKQFHVQNRSQAFTHHLCAFRTDALLSETTTNVNLVTQYAATNSQSKQLTWCTVTRLEIRWLSITYCTETIR